MRWTILVGILGLAIGFLVGRSQERVVEDVEKRAVVESDRRGSERARRGWSERTRGSRKREGRKMIVEAAQMGNELSEISQARLLKWILELEAGDFPEVLDGLAKLGGGGVADPFAADSGSADFLTVAMGRWYGLEGEVALDWVLTKPEVIGEWSEKRLLRKMIEDGYGKDPDRSFELMKKYVGTDGGVANSWLYQMGKWSRNYERELAELLIDQSADRPVIDDPFADDSGPVVRINSFIQGIVDGEREGEFREWLIAENDEPLLGMLDAMLERKRANEFKEEGWQALKGAIDRGDLQGSRHADFVFERWRKVDEGAALRWYLGQEAGGESRSEMIRRAATAIGGTAEVEDPFVNGIGNVDRVITFLNQMEDEGEPVDYAWKRVAGQAISGGQWDHLETMRPHLPLDVWNQAATKIEGAVLDSEVIYFGGSHVGFLEFNEGGEAVLERFGMKEQVLERVARQNEENLQKLHRILGVEEE